MMKRPPITFSIATLFTLMAAAIGGESSASAGLGFGKLSIAPCTAAVPLGKANLRVSGLVRQTGGYSGDYQIKVTPLFFAGEKGRLSVTVPDEDLLRLSGGATVEFTGRAISSGSGKTRPIRGRATPSGDNGGSLNLWFTADNTRIAFTTTYHFARGRLALGSKETMVAVNH